MVRAQVTATTDKSASGRKGQSVVGAVCEVMTIIDKRIIGWREWLAMPSLGIDRIKAKIDTGARTSALHAYDLESFCKDGAPWVRFTVHPLQRSKKQGLTCAAPVVDQRDVTSSTGHRETRYVIVVEISLGGESWPIEISLADRDEMGFRMLLGRTAVEGRMIVDPDRSYVMGRLRAPKKKTGDKQSPTNKEKAGQRSGGDREVTL